MVSPKTGRLPGTVPPYGFTDPGTATWFPQPAGWAGLTVAAQDDDPESTLAHYRRLLAARRALMTDADLAADLSPDTAVWLVPV